MKTVGFALTLLLASLSLQCDAQQTTPSPTGGQNPPSGGAQTSAPAGQPPSPNGRTPVGGEPPAKVNIPTVPGETQLPSPGKVPPRRADVPPLKTIETATPPYITTPGAPAGTPNVPVQRPLSANEASLLALRLQPDITVAQAAYFAQRGLTRQARSALGPQVTANGSYVHLETLHSVPTTIGSITIPTNPGVPNSPTNTYRIPGSSQAPTQSGALAEATLQQLIFDFNHTRDVVRQNEALERAANNNVTATQLNTIFLVKQAYYQYVENLQLVTVNDEEVNNAQDELNLALARYNSGIGEPGDVYSARTQKEQAIVALISARATAETSRISLAIMIGVDPRTPIQPADVNEPELKTDDVNALVAQGLKQRPEVLQAIETVKANQFGVSAAKTSNAPVINGEVNVIAEAPQDFSTSPSSFFTAGVTLSWDLFDSGLTRGKVDTARAMLLSAQAQLFSTQQSVKSDVTTNYINLRTSEQRLTSAQADVSNAVEDVRVAQGRYKTGIGEFTDVITAQALLLTARSNLVMTLQSIPLYRAGVEHAIGAHPTLK